MPIKYYTSHLAKTVSDHHIDYRVRGRLPDTYDLKWVDRRHPCKTGCWRFDHASGRHEIRLSVLAYPTLAKGGKAEGKRIAVPDLYRNVYEHEAAHSLYTSRDLDGLKKTLAAKKIPWRLLNLFEDVRIERLWIGKERDYRSFRWTRWEEHRPPLKTSATGLLFEIKTEGLTRGGRLPRAFCAFYHSLPFFRRVCWYAGRIMRAPTTEDLVPLLEQWMKEFPSTGDDTIEGEGGDGTGDMGEAMGEATGSAPANVPAADPKGDGASAETKHGTGSGTSEETGGSEGGEGTRAASTETPTHGRGSGGSASTAIPIVDDESRYAVRLALLMASAFRKRGCLTKGPTARASRRLNLKGLMRGDWSRPFIGKTFGKDLKPHIALIVDCSGSMGALTFFDRDKKIHLRTDDCGRILVRAFNELARRGLITCTAYGSSDGGCHVRFDLPVPDHKLGSGSRLEAFSGSEGIGITLAPGLRSGLKHKGSGSFFEEIATKSKVAIVYTDGCITDIPVDRAPLRARGVYTVGAYAGAVDRTPALRKHFDYAISRESLTGVADALVRTMKTIPSK